jgi:hypothetical protein
MPNLPQEIIGKILLMIGNVEIALQLDDIYATKKLCQINKIGYIYAIKTRNIKLIKFLHENGLKHDNIDWECTGVVSNLFKKCALNIEIIKYLNYIGIEFTNDNISWIFYKGDINDIKAFNDIGLLDDKKHYDAVESQNIENIKFYYNIYPDDSYVDFNRMFEDDQEVNVEIIKFIHTRGHNLTENMMKNAIDTSNIESIAYLCDNGIHFPIKYVYKIAGEKLNRRGSTTLFDYIQDKELKFRNDTMTLAFKCGNLEMVEHLKKNLVEFPDNALEIATENGHIKLVEYIKTLQ